MEFPLLNYLKEIQLQLRPTLQELGLRAKIGTISLRSEYRMPSSHTPGRAISFIDPKGSYFSPVEIDLNREGSEPRSGHILNGATLRAFEWLQQDIGDNCWRLITNQRYYDERLEGDPAAILDAVRDHLRHYGTVPFVTRAMEVSTDPKFGSLYETVRNLRISFKDELLTCSRENGFECLNFLHWKDESSWRVALEGRDAVVYIVGERVLACDAECVASHLNTMLQDYGYRGWTPG